MPQNYTEREKFELFVKRVSELKQTRLYSSGGLVHTEFQMIYKNDSNGTEIDFATTHRDEDDYKSFLMSFRLFVLKSESTYLQSIFDLCVDTANSEAPQAEFQKAKVHWESYTNGAQEVAFYEEEKRLTSIDILSTWLDGVYFHSDSDKAQRIADWGIFLPLPQYEFDVTVQSLTNIIIWLGDYIEHGLKNNWFSFTGET